MMMSHPTMGNDAVATGSLKPAPDSDSDSDSRPGPGPAAAPFSSTPVAVEKAIIGRKRKSRPRRTSASSAACVGAAQTKTPSPQIRNSARSINGKFMEAPPKTPAPNRRSSRRRSSRRRSASACSDTAPLPVDTSTDKLGATHPGNNEMATIQLEGSGSGSGQGSGSRSGSSKKRRRTRSARSANFPSRDNARRRMAAALDEEAAREAAEAAAAELAALALAAEGATGGGIISAHHVPCVPSVTLGPAAEAAAGMPLRPGPGNTASRVSG